MSINRPTLFSVLRTIFVYIHDDRGIHYLARSMLFWTLIENNAALLVGFSPVSLFYQYRLLLKNNDSQSTRDKESRDKESRLNATVSSLGSHEIRHNSTSNFMGSRDRLLEENIFELSDGAFSVAESPALPTNEGYQSLGVKCIPRVHFKDGRLTYYKVIKLCLDFLK